MASPNETAPSQDKKKDDEKPVANGVKKDEPEELVLAHRLVTYTHSRARRTRT
jgi:hypothetical protein